MLLVQEYENEVIICSICAMPNLQRLINHQIRYHNIFLGEIVITPFYLLFGHTTEIIGFNMEVDVPE